MGTKDGTESTESTEGTSTESTEGNAPANDEGTNTEGSGSTATPEDELPEWARNELKKARGDAARYRTGLRDAEAKLAAAKTPEEFETATRELAEQNAKLSREIAVRDVAAKHGLPPALAARLQGSTPEEMEADAVELAKLVAPAPTSSGTPSGGLDPSADDDDEMDPRKLAARHRRR